MAFPTQDIAVKVSSEGAQSFVDWYYRDLNDNRSLLPYYVNASTKYTNAGINADITINGGVLASPAEYEALLDEQRGAGKPNGPADSNASSSSYTPSTNNNKVRYEVDSFDAQVVNDDYSLACPEHILSRGPDRGGGRVSAVVTVMGVVHVGGGPDALRRRFHEVFVLVPNWDVRGRNPPRGAKRFLIASQNYRTL